ncbi:MAG: hypothetical protein GY851_34080 [bacterium]|nr:hypothetical protein [bacterium]
MGRKYTRAGFRSSAKGAWHRGGGSPDPVAGTRISPEQAKRLLSIGLMAACGLYLSGLLFAKTRERTVPPAVSTVATVVSKAVEEDSRYYLVLDIPRETGDPIRAKVRVEESEWRSFESGDRVGASYRATIDGARVDELHRIDPDAGVAETDPAEPSLAE